MARVAGVDHLVTVCTAGSGCLFLHLYPFRQSDRSPFYGIIAERVIALERGSNNETPTSTSALLATAWAAFAASCKSSAICCREPRHSSGYCSVEFCAGD